MLPSLNRSRIVGFDKLFDDIFQSTTQTYPPYNLIKIGDQYVIDIALAGFKPEDISVTVEDRRLTIASTSDKKEDTSEYIHRGIATRAFSMSFRLDNHIEVSNAEFNNGILSVKLEKIVPEELQPRKIAIEYKG